MQDALSMYCPVAPKGDGEGVAPPELDEWLFRRLTEAIVKGDAEGALYRSGKHVIFSNPNRNQVCE